MTGHQIAGGSTSSSTLDAATAAPPAPIPAGATSPAVDVGRVTPQARAIARAGPATHTAEWHQERREGIGASDIPIILDIGPWGSPWALWAVKSGLMSDEREDTQRLRIGRRMEHVLAAEFTDATGLHVAGEQTLLRHPERPWMRATVDGFVFESPNATDLDSALGVVEFKTAREFAWKDGVPPHYLAQVQWQMAVSGMERAWVGVMFAGFRFEVFEVARDEADIAFMVERAAEFWQLVEEGNPPPIDGSDATAHAMATIWPEHIPGTICHAQDGLKALLGSHAVIAARIREDKAALAEIDNEIAACVADDETIYVDGAPAWTYRSQTRTTVDRARLERDHPEIAAAYSKTGTPFRVLRAITAKGTK